MNPTSLRNDNVILKNILLLSLILFGLITLFMSSSVLFDWFGIREREGNFVPFVVWANWICGFLYLGAAYHVVRHRKSARFPLLVAIVILLCADVLLFSHVNSGGLYETKTVGAMVFRTVLTAVFYFTALQLKK